MARRYVPPTYDDFGAILEYGYYEDDNEPEESPGQLINPRELDSFPSTPPSASPDFAGGESQDHDFTKEEADQLWRAGVWDQVKGLSKQALDLFKDKNGSYDLKKLLAMGAGLIAANKPNNAAPTGYQGKIPKLTATSNMLTAPPVGRRPGSGGINYGGGTTYRDEKGNIVSSNEKTLEELRAAAASNPYNQVSTYGAKSGLSATSLDELLAVMKPSEAATTANTAANTAANAAAAASATNASGLAALTAAINAAKPAATPAPATTPTTPRPTAAAASGNTVELRTQLRNEYAAGPKTQDALDKLLLKYPPAVMQAEFPEFGGVANYNNATMEAYYRQEQQARQANREALRGSGQEVYVANPGGDVQMSSPGAPKMSAIPQSELAAARAKLSPEQAALIDWRLAQVNPMTGQRVADDYNRQGSNPYAGNAAAQAQEQLDRAGGRKELLSQSGVSTAGIAPWEDPNWRDQQKMREDAERARADQQRADYMAIPEAQRTVAGPGGATAPTAGYGNYLGTPMYEAPTATGGIMEWYNANVGRTDDRAQGDLNNFLANSGYTAKDIATALPQWGEADLQTAIAAAKGAPAPAPVVAPAPVTAAPAPVAAAPAPEPAPQENYFDPTAGGGAAAGGLLPNGFVIPADVVSHLGNGSSEAGLKLLVSNLGAEPIKGKGDGMSDSIPTTIGGKQEARVANEEAVISPEMVKKIGGGDAEKGAKKLYAMMDRVREERTGTTKQGKQIDPNKFMPGGSVKKYETGGTTKLPTGATGAESSLSNWAGDYVTNMLGQGAAQANKPYEAYTGPLTAGASGLQNQAFGMASNLRTPGSIGQAAGTAGGIANLAANMRYTPQTTNFLGQPNVSGLGMTPPAGGDVQGRSIGSPQPGPDGGMISEDSWMMPGESPDRFAVDGGMTGGVMRPPKPDYSTMPVPEGGLMARGAQQGSDIAQQYMNPYLESALRPQMAEMQRVADIARMSDASRLTQAGAYGGSRQAIMESEGRRNLLGKQSEALGQGYATAYDKAMAQFNADQTRRAQEAQFGATFGLDSLKTGIQGAQTQAQAGALQSTAEQAGLRGLLDAGAVERGIESEGIAADKAQFEEARLNPFKMVQFQQSLLSGMPLASQSYSMPGTSNLQQFSEGASTIDRLLKILSGQQQATAKN